MKNGLYAQVVIIKQSESDNKKEKEKTKKYNFPGQSVILRRQFDLDHDWLKEKFMTREPYFFTNCIKLNVGVMIQKHIK